MSTEKKEKLWEIDRDGNITEQHLKFCEFLSREGGCSVMDGLPYFHLRVDRAAQKIVLVDINQCEVVVRYKKIIDPGETNAVNLRFFELLRANFAAHTELCKQSEVYLAAFTRHGHKMQWLLAREADNIVRFANYAARQGIQISILCDGRVVDNATLKVLGTVAVEIPPVVVGARISGTEAMGAGITAGTARPQNPRTHTDEQILQAAFKEFEAREEAAKRAGQPPPQSMEFEYDPRDQLN